MKVVLKQEDAQAILDYLTTRPFIEVVRLVPMLTQAESLGDNKKPEDSEDKK
jgi:hypothetical protein